MKKSSIVWVAVVVIIIVAGGIWWAVASRSNSQQPQPQNNAAPMIPAPAPTTNNTGNAPTPTPAPTSTGTSPATANTTLTLATNSALGNYLVAANGMTLYRYTKDMPNMSMCTGSCAALWPPYTVSASDAASLTTGPGLSSGKLGSIKLSDGSLQVTYNSQPLYFYAKDSKVGDTNGQNVGGVWFVVNP